MVFGSGLTAHIDNIRYPNSWQTSSARVRYTTLTTEAEYSINFSEQQKNFFKNDDIKMI